jgi:hypothetical protein
MAKVWVSVLGFVQGGGSEVVEGHGGVSEQHVWKIGLCRINSKLMGSSEGVVSARTFGPDPHSPLHALIRSLWAIGLLHQEYENARSVHSPSID